MLEVATARRVRLAAVLFLAGRLALEPGPARAGGLDDASADKVQATAVIPDEVRKVGEVRLISRGDAVVVQTLLATKLLPRVIAEIHKKEEAGWPAGTKGEDGMRAYLAALDAAGDKVGARPPDADRRHRLLVEFVVDATASEVVLGSFTSAPAAATIVPESREILAVVPVPREYALRNVRLILADSFKVPEKEVDRLGPLGPAAAAAPGNASP